MAARNQDKVAAAAEQLRAGLPAASLEIVPLELVFWVALARLATRTQV